jgi:hypothetical protein
MVHKGIKTGDTDEELVSCFWRATVFQENLHSIWFSYREYFKDNAQDSYHPSVDPVYQEIIINIFELKEK